MSIRHVTAMAIAWMVGAAAVAAPVPLHNGGFEANWITVSFSGSDCCSTFAYQPTGPDLGWTFGAGTGLAAYFNQPPTIAPYEGQRFAFLQTATQPLFQSFVLGTEADVTVSFAAVLRPGRAPGQTVQVEVDGLAWGQANVEGQWIRYGVPLGRLGPGAHTLAFRGISAFDRFGDTTAFLDAVSLDARAVSIPEPASLGLVLAALLAGRFRRSSGAAHA